MSCVRRTVGYYYLLGAPNTPLDDSIRGYPSITEYAIYFAVRSEEPITYHLLFFCRAYNRGHFSSPERVEDGESNLEFQIQDRGRQPGD